MSYKLSITDVDHGANRQILTFTVRSLDRCMPSTQDPVMLQRSYTPVCNFNVCLLGIHKFIKLTALQKHVGGWVGGTRSQPGRLCVYYWSRLFPYQPFPCRVRRCYYFRKEHISWLMPVILLSNFPIISKYQSNIRGTLVTIKHHSEHYNIDSSGDSFCAYLVTLCYITVVSILPIQWSWFCPYYALFCLSVF